jgi:predicted nucleic acid-binding protein
MNLVIDASVLIKFYIPEVLSDKADLLLGEVKKGNIELFALDLIYPEAGNILWKKNRVKELTPSEVVEITDAFLGLPLRTEPSIRILPLSVEIAVAYGLPVYDAMYISLAKVYNTAMITADKRLVDKVTRTDLKKSTTWLGNYG